MPNTASFSMTEPFGTDAAYQTAITGFAGLLDSAGWARTSNTGQVTLASALRSGAATNYEVRKSNDGLTDLYLKITYALVNNDLFPIIVLGTGSDGAGTITGPAGQTISMNTLATGSTSNTGTFTYQICWATLHGSFVMSCKHDSSNPWLLCVERSRDSSGSPTSDYATMYMSQSYNVLASRHLQQTLFIGGSYTAGKTSQSTAWASALPSITNNVYSGDVGVSPVRPMIPHEGNTSKLLLIAKADFSTTGQFTTTVYGSSHNYMAMGSNGLFAFVGPGEMSGCQPCMLWE
ncbi:MAG: hypothetical protein ACM3JB_07250 [Acidobacteriaceae bacterium]